MPYAKLVDALAQQVGLGPPQLVAHGGQPLDPDDALVLHLCRLLVEPREQRRGSSAKKTTCVSGILAPHYLLSHNCDGKSTQFCDNAIPVLVPP